MGENLSSWGLETANQVEGHREDERHVRTPCSVVYVGNIEWTVTAQDLAEHMQVKGSLPTKVKIFTSKNGKSKGCALVYFASQEEADQAIQVTNDSLLRGRKIFVRLNHEKMVLRPETPSTPVARTQRRGASVYVGNLHYMLTWQDIKDHMSQVGPVAFVRILNDSNGQSKGCAIVAYKSLEAAQKAIALMNNSILMERTIYVREDRESTPDHRMSPTPRSLSIYVWNIPRNTDWRDLKDFMRMAGNVDSATMLPPDSGPLGGRAIVKYQKVAEVGRAIRELNGVVFGSAPIYVQMDQNRSANERFSPVAFGDAIEAKGFYVPAVHRTSSYEQLWQGVFEESQKMNMVVEKEFGKGEIGEDMEGNVEEGVMEEIRQKDQDGIGEKGMHGKTVTVANLSRSTTVGSLKNHFEVCGEVDSAEMVSSDAADEPFGRIVFAKSFDAIKAVNSLDGSFLDGNQLKVEFEKIGN